MSTLNNLRSFKSLNFNSGINLSSGRFLGIMGQNSTFNFTGALIDQNCNITSFSVHLNNAPGGVNSRTFEFIINSLGTSIFLVFTGLETFKTLSMDRNLVAGDRIGLFHTVSGASNSAGSVIINYKY